ncbi:YdcF family protein [Octadecabacter ascidiaceicola]|uniref:DUF218 domain-containing protein n=1 Tax=Octadecabacter ascidiaceicola TaxID=1655543 RepID=A0A238JM87_9RHOB|nr:YdcF family protein [Octadecabacter ascidiaceicola]SMX31297.1 hypothetical protein OCA8868_00289 [Octadecabacter ascidiaceicola]
MGFARFLGRLVILGIAAFTLMTLAMIAWTFLWPEPDVRGMKQADVIACLGAGMEPDGTLDLAALTRVDRCVQLYEADLAPVIVFSGGTARADGPSAGRQMARYAQSLGVPAEATIIEGRAHSTLQNALFTLELAPNAQDFIVVTEAFHLPRSWVSFHWARWEMGVPNTKNFYLVMSEDVRRLQPHNAIAWEVLARESLAIWFNAARALVFSASTNKPIGLLH